MPNDAPRGEGIPLPVSADALRPLIQATVAETIAAIEKDREQVQGERLAYSEAEAAALLGLNVHQLRDERKRGRIAHTTIVGKTIRYTPEDLIAYLRKLRVEAAA